MKISFIFASRPLKNGNHNLQLLFSSSGAIQMPKNTGLKFHKKHWSKKDNRVLKTHKNALDLNLAIDQFKDKMNKAVTKYETGTLNYYEVIEYVLGTTDTSSVDDFVNTYVKNNKTSVTYLAYKHHLAGFKKYAGIKRKLQFRDINYSLFLKAQKQLKKAIRDGIIKGRSASDYLGTTRSIYKLAHKVKVVSEPIDENLYDFQFKSGSSQNRGNTSEDIEDAISNIKDIKQWQACAFWLLNFAMRGMYNSDIVQISDDNLKSKKLKPNAKVTDDWLNNNLYLDTVRSKSKDGEEMPMFIKLFPEVLELIEKIRYSTIYTWAGRKCNGKDIIANINNKVKILDYDVKENADYHFNLFKYRQNKFKELGHPNIQLKKARKSFEMAGFTIKKEDGTKKYEIALVEILTGRTSRNQTLIDSYLDFKDEEIIDMVDACHLDIMKKFKWFDLQKKLIDKLVEIVIENDKYPKWILRNSLVIQNTNDKMLVGIGFDGAIDFKNIKWVEVERKYRKYFRQKAVDENFKVIENKKEDVYFTNYKPDEKLTDEDYIQLEPPKKIDVEFQKRYSAIMKKHKEMFDKMKVEANMKATKKILDNA